MSDVIYCGHAKFQTIQTHSGGEFDKIKVSMTAENVQTITEHLDNGWVNLEICERKTPSEKGMTHYCKVDTWKPEPRDDAQPASSDAPETTKADLDNLPF